MPLPLGALRIARGGLTALRESGGSRILGRTLAWGGGLAGIGLGASYALNHVGQAAGSAAANVGGGLGVALRDLEGGAAQGAKEWIVPAAVGVGLVLLLMRGRSK